MSLKCVEVVANFDWSETTTWFEKSFACLFLVCVWRDEIYCFNPPEN